MTNEHFTFTTELDVVSKKRLDAQFVEDLHKIREAAARQVAALVARQSGILEHKVQSRPYSWVVENGEFSIL